MKMQKKAIILILILWLQVPLLLSIGEEDTALMKAIESGDTDLVYLVLFHIWQKVICLENSTGTPIFLLQVSIYWITINNLENKKMLSLCRENLWIFSEWYKLEPLRVICLWFMHGRIDTLARYIFKLHVCVLCLFSHASRALSVSGAINMNSWRTSSYQMDNFM